jgi:hypothetical protein
MTPEKWKGLIERAYEKVAEFGEGQINDIEKARAVHELMDQEGERVSGFDSMKEGEVYAAVFGSDGIRLFVMPCKGSIAGADTFNDVYTDFYEIKSATHETPDTEGVVRDGRVRLRDHVSFHTLGVYHLNGHSKLKDMITEEIREKDKKHYIGFVPDNAMDN